MSGGSWNYCYCQFEEIAERLISEKCEYRKALGKHLSKVSRALREIEWVDSGDCSHPEEIPYIKEALGKQYETLVLDEIKTELKQLIEKAQEIIK